MFETDKYSLSCEGRSSNIELFSHLSSNRQVRQQRETSPENYSEF
jgi:hypothetical protein